MDSSEKVEETPIPDKAQDSSSQKTPQTSQPPAPVTNGSGVPQEELDRALRIIEQQEAVLRDQYRINTELTQRFRGVDDRLRKVEAPPGPSAEELNQGFWKDPIGTMKGMITEVVSAELKATVRPLNEAAQETAYDRMKAKLKVQYPDVWDKISPSVDAFITNATSKGVELNEELIGIAGSAVYGNYVRQELAAGRTIGTPSPDPSRGRPAPVSDPPHLRPSAPQIPGKEEEAPKLRDLTENEARLARERKQTKEEFLAWLEVPPEGVIYSKIGRKEAAK